MQKVNASLRSQRTQQHFYVLCYAHEKPCLESGSERMRVPVTAKMALHTAGSSGGSAGSPRPVGGLSVLKKCTSISAGIWFMRTGGYSWKLLCTARPPSIVIS